VRTFITLCLLENKTACCPLQFEDRVSIIGTDSIGRMGRQGG
jgi:hypothetical protein